MKSIAILIVTMLFLAVPSGSVNLADNEVLITDDPGYVAGATIYLDFSFSQPEITESDYEGFHWITMDDFNYLEEPGLPMIPFKSVNVLLPFGEEVDDIQVVNRGEVPIHGNYLIEPGKIPVFFNSDQKRYDSPLDFAAEASSPGISEEVVSNVIDQNINLIDTTDPDELYLDEETYNSMDRYPENLYSRIFVQQLRGYKILILRLFPVQYIPKLEQLYFTEKMDVKITTKPMESPDSSMLRQSQKDISRVLELVDNPWTMDTYNTVRETRSLVDPLDTYQYVIVTNSALQSSFQPLVDWKNSIGVTATNVTLEDITADPDYNGADTQEEIRNFIIDAYTNWETEYVLLGGDTDVIPHRGVYGSLGEYNDSDIPCDLYYGGLDGDWDNDGDGIFGEGDSALGGNGTAGEEADFYAEVYVGRAPASAASSVTNFVNKVIAYEQTPLSASYLNNSLMLGAKADEITDGSLTCDKLTEYLPDSYVVTKLYERDDTASISATNANLNLGQHIVYHIGHSNNYEIGVACIDYQEYYDKTDIDSLTNSEYFLYYSVGCYSNAFDNRLPDNTYVEDAIGEKFVYIPEGAFAYIGNTRYGLYSSGQPGYGASERYSKKFFESLFEKNILNIGKTLQDSKESLMSDVGAVGQMRWVYFTLNLLGDPDTPYLMTSMPPKDLKVVSIDSHSDEEIYTTGQHNIQSTIKNSGIYNEKDFNVSLEIRELVTPKYSKTFYSDNMEGYSYPDRSGTKLVEYDRLAGQWENGAPSNTYGPTSAFSGTNCWGTNIDGDYRDQGQTTFAGVLEDQGIFVDIYGRNDFLDIPSQVGDNIFINISWTSGANLDLFLYKPSDVLSHQTTGSNYIDWGMSISPTYEDINYTVQPGDGDGIFQVRVELYSGGDTSYYIEEITVDGVTYWDSDFSYSLKRVDNEGSGYEYPERTYHYVYIPYDPSHVFYLWYYFNYDVDITLYDPDGDSVIGNTLDNDGFWIGSFYADEPGLWTIRLIGEGPDITLDDYEVTITHPELFTTFQLPPVDLSNPKIEFVNLSFWQWYDMEEDYDYGYVFVSPFEGFWWYYLASYTGNNSANGWEYEELSLNDFIGFSEVVIMFAFSSDSFITKPGWYLDDIQVHGTILPTERIVYGPQHQTVTAELQPGEDISLNWNYNFDDEGYYKIIVKTHLPNDKNGSNDVLSLNINTNYPPETPTIHSNSHSDETVWYNNNDLTLNWITASIYTDYMVVGTDETIVSGRSDMNFDFTTEWGGAYVGFDASYGYGTERSYFRFDLSSLPSDAALTKASFYSYLYFEIHSGDQPIGAYFCSDDTWDNTTITWDNRPPMFGTPIDINNGPFEPHLWYVWDITSDVKSECAGDQTLTVVLRDVVEGADTWKCFVEKEYEYMLGSLIKYSYTTILPSEIVGYSHELDHNPLTVPDSSIDSVVNSTTYNDLADGIWYFHVNACDDDGNWSETDHYKISIDTTPPISSVNVLPDYHNSDSINIDYTADDGSGSGIDRVSFYYRLNGGYWYLYGDFTSSVIAFDSTMTGGNGLYEFYTRAWDEAGNNEPTPIDPDSSTIIDTTLPSSNILPTSTYQTTPVINIYYTAEDAGGSGIQSIEIYYSTNNGTTWQLYGTNYTSSPILFDSLLTEGDDEYGFYSIAVDYAGNIESNGAPDPGKAPKIGTIVDTTKPDSSVGILPTYSNQITFTISASATDTNGISSVDLWYMKDSGSWIKYDNKTSAPWSWSFDASEAGGDGIYSFYTRAYDTPNNYEDSPMTNDTWSIVDTLAPTIAIDSHLNNTIMTVSDVNLIWTGSDSTSGINRYEVRIDNGLWIDNGKSLSCDFESADEGSHSFTVCAYDNANNYRETLIFLTVDTEKPTITLIDPSNDAIITTSDVDVSWSGSDSTSGIHHYEIKIDDKEYSSVPSGSKYTFKGIEDGSHTITIKAVDEGGNSEEILFKVNVDTNPFSFSGPQKGYPSILLIFVVIIIITLFLLLMKRKKDTEAEPEEETVDFEVESSQSTPPEETTTEFTEEEWVDFDTESRKNGQPDEQVSQEEWD